MDFSNAPHTEREFAACVAAMADEPPGEERTSRLLGLLCEEHAQYRQRSSAATSRMRGWVLLALARPALPDAATLHVIEELDNGRAPYLVAAAARALRGSPAPTPAMATFVMQALARIRDSDEYVDLDNYGGASGPESGTTVFAELLATLRWLGPCAADAVAELEAMCASPDRPLAGDEAADVERTVTVIRAAAGRAQQPGAAEPASANSPCCGGIDLWGAFRRWLPGASGRMDAIEFEDQDGGHVAYGEFFTGRPAIVVFFYTRCDNAQKCSLTVSKLARVQQILHEAGMAGRIRTAAITYDSTYDLPGRLRGYAQSRGVSCNADHRVLRTVAGEAQLHAHFRLGVNFVESLVNRHRIEAYLVDSQGRIAASFERIRWDEQRIVEEAIGLLRDRATDDVPALADGNSAARAASSAVRGAQRPGHGARHVSGEGASVRADGHSRDGAPAPAPGVAARHSMAPAVTLALALFPKCPVCGATYLSLSGMAALPYLPALYWLFPVLLALCAVNLVSLALLAVRRRRWEGFALALVGTVIVLGVGVAAEQRWALPLGVAVSIAGSLVGVALTGRESLVPGVRALMLRALRAAHLRPFA